MIVNVTTPVKPPCWNREEDTVRGHWRYGIDQYTGEEIAVWVSSAWASHGCATWAGRGIGPTPEATHYPQAHGWAEFCKTCKRLPPEGREAMGMTNE